MFELTVHTTMLDGPHGDDFQFLRLERFGDVAVRAELYCLYGGFNRAYPVMITKGSTLSTARTRLSSSIPLILYVYLLQRTRS